MNQYLYLVAILVLLNSCQTEKVEKPYKPSNAHKAYQSSLKETNLHLTALGKDWMDESDKALSNPISVSAPYEELLYIDSKKAFAIGYQFSVKRGQKIVVSTNIISSDSLRIFMDVFRHSNDSVKNWRIVASSKKGLNEIIFEPRKSADYILRIQPELLRGGNLKIRIYKEASLTFPVLGKDDGAIQSFFNDPRDGGKRDHHGVDIFARRNTSVIAPTKSKVSKVGDSKIGGNHVWLYDAKRNMYLYFAHLETRNVEAQTYVEEGDIIGTVGNSGNAITTAPHLHFGIYRRGSGPVNPYFYISKVKNDLKKISVDTIHLGRYVQSNKLAYLYPDYRLKSDPIDTIEKQTVFKIAAINGNSARVELPDGALGYLSSNAIESLSYINRNNTSPNSIQILDSPEYEAKIISYIESGSSYDILGKYDKYFFVQVNEDVLGWINTNEFHEQIL